MCAYVSRLECAHTYERARAPFRRFSNICAALIAVVDDIITDQDFREARSVCLDLRISCVLRDGLAEGPGWHEAQWFGQDAAGRQVGAGVYFYRLEAGSYSETRRMTLLK